MAFAAQTGAVPRLGWLMWLTVMIWTVIYDTMYAMVDRADDLRLGIRSTAIMFGPADVFIINVLQAVFLLALFLIGEVAFLGIWFRLALVVVGLLMLYQAMLIRQRNPEACFQAFLHNRYIGAVVFAGIVLAYTFAFTGPEKVLL